MALLHRGNCVRMARVKRGFTCHCIASARLRLDWKGAPPARRGGDYQMPRKLHASCLHIVLLLLSALAILWRTGSGGSKVAAPR